VEDGVAKWLLEENERLLMENRMLRNQCDLAAPATSQDANSARMVFTQDGVCWVVHADAPSPVRPLPVPGPQKAQRQQGHSGERGRLEAHEQPALPQPGQEEQPKGPAQEPERRADEKADERTTVMLRNLPNNYTRAMVIDLLDKQGFAGLYDFLYLPIDLRSSACLGYAFVNLVDPGVVPSFWEKFEGFSNWALPSHKVCYVSWSSPHQGLEAHVERYRNSPIMHTSVADECKPVLFKSGARVPFPAGTKSNRAPRLRQPTHKAAATNRQR
jgi:hypothetical protein